MPATAAEQPRRNLAVRQSAQSNTALPAAASLRPQCGGMVPTEPPPGERGKGPSGAQANEDAGRAHTCAHARGGATGTGKDVGQAALGRHAERVTLVRQCRAGGEGAGKGSSKPSQDTSEG